jgi:GntP family gluconate:H+ symporter
VLAWVVAAVMKIAQGSGTVSMITSAGIMFSLIGAGTLPYHPVYIFLAIGFGAMFITWMNDSGFWVICKLSGFTEKQTLQTWTVVLGLIGVLGLIEILILSRILPFI